MKKIIAVAIAGLSISGMAHSASFLNGGFEDGTFGGWTLSSGSFSYGTPTGNADGTLALNPASYTTNNNWQGAIVTNLPNVTYDPIVGGGLLPTVKYGNYSARINNSINDYSVNVIKQSVSNYDGSSINFAWAAVLEASHDETDSDIFGLKIINTSTNTTLYDAVYSSATGSAASSLFTYRNGWYYTNWQEISLNVTQGQNYEIYLLAADCSYGGHAGYVYLDGFGTVQGGGGDNGTGGGTVPEPTSLALLGLGLAGLGAIRRRKQA